MKINNESWRHWHFVRTRNENRKKSGGNKKPLPRFKAVGPVIYEQPALRCFPADFRLFQNTDNVVGALFFLRDTLRKMTLRQRLRLNRKRSSDPFRPMGKPRRLGRLLSFGTIQRIDMPAALVLAAEIDRANTKLKANLPAVKMDDWDPSVYQFLSDIGFLNLLSNGDSSRNLSRENVLDAEFMVWPFASHKLSEDSVGRSMIETLFREALSPDVALELDERLCMLMSSAIDVIQNVRDHAYPPGEYRFPHVSRWWVCGAVNKINKRITFCIYDQGKTIPGHLSLMKNKILPPHRSIIEEYCCGNKTDCDVLEYVLENPISSSGDRTRGLGLSDAKPLIDLVEDGRLDIMSGNGHICYADGHIQSKRENSWSIGGTLVCWELAL